MAAGSANANKVGHTIEVLLPSNGQRFTQKTEG